MSALQHQNTHNQTIGENIRLYRIQAGLTHTRLSRYIKARHDVTIKETKLRGYEKARFAVPALYLHYIAAALGVEERAFFEDACPGMLLDKHTLKLVEAYKTIPRTSYRHALFHLACGLAK